MKTTITIESGKAEVSIQPETEIERLVLREIGGSRPVARRDGSGVIVSAALAKENGNEEKPTTLS